MDAATCPLGKTFCSETAPDPFILVIFGASGDLARRKLLPALFNLFQKDLLPEKFTVIGCARSPLDDQAFRDRAATAIRQNLGATVPQKMLKIFLENLFYLPGAYDDDVSYRNLGEKIKEIEGQETATNRIFYLSTPAGLYAEIIQQLGEAGLVKEDFDGFPARRVVIEKPFGRDFSSARDLDRKIRQILQERQIFRIDHYLGKETVQNILMFRFANAVFEPVWNNRYIANVQITVAEAIGVEHRAGYFDQTGLLRDMFQNHMFQLLALVAMEPPASFDADRVRDEKVKLLNSVHPFPLEELSQWLVRGQYKNGTVKGQAVPGYREEEGVVSRSPTETYLAAKVMIDNWRWHGVPFYLRTGKRLPRRVSEIVLTFKNVPHSIFYPLLPEDLQPNVLVFNVQPEEGVALYIQAKRPGPKLCMGNITMDFKYHDVFGGSPPDAYERLLLDSMLGDHTLFIRSDTIDISWSLLTPILKAWEAKKNLDRIGKLHSYSAGTWGPKAADQLLAADGTQWREP